LILVCAFFIDEEESVLETFKKSKKPKLLKSIQKSKLYKATGKLYKKAGKLYKKTGINKYLAPKKKKKKPKRVFNLKPVASADYSDNIIAPYTGDNYGSIRKDVLEYGKALEGKASEKLVSPAPLGKQYFFDTGIKCADMDTGKLVDRYSIIDSRVGQINEDGAVDNSIFASAIADFNQSTIFKKKPTLKQTLEDKCVKITIEPVDVYGKKLKPETRHVALLDVKRYNDMQGGSSDEGFATLDMEKMDLGQQAFIYSASALGLYLFLKAFRR
jgi:hypothetical protein